MNDPVAHFSARTVRQPGPEQLPRIDMVPARGKSFTFNLEPGLTLLEAVRRGFANEGFTGGVVEFDATDHAGFGLESPNIKNVIDNNKPKHVDVDKPVPTSSRYAMALDPFAYVMPALSIDGKNAAFYSPVFRPAGVSWLEAGAMTFGRRDGAPFFHCHALWREADGKRIGGHILPEETVIAETCQVTALGLDGASFEAGLDQETNFKLFGPLANATRNTAADIPVLAIRLRPNQDFSHALEEACRAHGFARARIRGGVGSIIGARFVDGTEVRNFATEVFIRNGIIAPDASGRIYASIDVGLVDHTGQIASGVLIRGDNPVLMTFELVLEKT